MTETRQKAFHDPRDEVLGQHRLKHAAADTVLLDFGNRHRRRMAMTGTRGLEFLLDLEHAIALRGGDALELEDGRLIEVVAAPEPLMEIRGSDPPHLVRVAWHLGNRHLPTQIMPRAAHPSRPCHRGDGERSRRPLIAIEARSIPKAAPMPRSMPMRKIMTRMVMAHHAPRMIMPSPP